MNYKSLTLVLVILIFGGAFAGCGNGRHMPIDSTSASATDGQNRVVAAQVFDFKTDILPIFRKQCAFCHNPRSPALQPNWLDYPTSFALRANLYRRVVEIRDMPPSGVMTESDRTKMARWIQLGAPLEIPRRNITAGTP